MVIGVYGNEILKLRSNKILQPFLQTQMPLGNCMKSYPFYSIIKYLKLLNETFNCPQLQNEIERYEETPCTIVFEIHSAG